MKKIAILLCAMGLLSTSVYGFDDSNPFHLNLGLGGYFKKGVSKSTGASNTVPNLKHNQKSYEYNLGLSYFKSDAFYGDLQLHYRGSQDRSRASVLDGRDYAYDADLKLGYAFGWDAVRLTPFIVGGYKSTILEMSTMGSIVPAGSYFVSRYGYAGVGFRLDSSLSKHWDLGLIAQIDGQVSKPTVKTNIVQSGLTIANKEWKAKKTYNWKVELPITYNIPQTSSALRLTPYFQTENVDRLETGSAASDFSALQSKEFLNQHLWGARLEYIFSF